MAAGLQALDVAPMVASLQTAAGTAAIGPGQAAGAQLNATVPAGHHHQHLVEALVLNGRQNGSAGGAAWFAIVVKAVLLAKSPGPAVVTSSRRAQPFKLGLGIVRPGKRYRLNQKEALADLFLVLAGGGEQQHGAWGWVWGEHPGSQRAGAIEIAASP